MTDISGICPARFSAVKDAFAANFTDAPEGLNEQAARFSVCIEGETVIDLWGGRADAAGTRAFGPDTLVPVFSTGKAIMALMIATCVERGLLATDACGLQEDLADQVLGLGGGLVELAHRLLHLAARNGRPAVEPTTDQSAPADHGPQLFAHIVAPDAALFEEGHILFGRRAGLLGHVGDLAIDFLVADLEIFVVGDLLGLEAFLDQCRKSLLLDGRNILVGGLDLAHGDDRQHPLTQVEACDHLVIDRGDDAVGEGELGRGSCRSSRGRGLWGGGRLGDRTSGDQRGHGDASRATSQTHGQS
jgi:hypothetical protein